MRALAGLYHGFGGLKRCGGGGGGLQSRGWLLQSAARKSREIEQNQQDVIHLTNPGAQFPMPRSDDGPRGERRERKESFQSFNRPRTKVTRTSGSGKVYVDYKDTESLRKMMSANGKILSRKRSGANAMEQRMIARAVKRARYMALLPYVSAAF
jgi:small subunit ribosomal protein S18